MNFVLGLIWTDN